MNFEKAIRNINRSLDKKQPKSFNANWIKYRCNISYRFIINNITNEFGEPDWDLVTANLDRQFQRLWSKGLKRKQSNEYSDASEVILVLNPYKEKLYTFISQIDQEDRKICDRISISLVRLAQRGNLFAIQKLKQLIPFLINQWIEGYKLNRWRGYNDLINICIDDCIRRYRYSGSFIGYLNKTMEYAGRPLKSIEAFSLDKKSQITDKAIIDNVAKDYQTGEVKIF
ncbi:TPA: hypothetical protein DCZ15_02465 [Candidatus Falkowbacteria bacterium]|nr:MAG: hypothetical protein UV95_C0001G0113 [Candidatus Falkowbacteria bacterium GW2011_GWF2_43_32]HBA36718.1 hypothetical protein [Candidatus Falkowbacteria bacterium]